MEHRLAEVRDRKGVKQAELARTVGLSRGQIANLESGNRKIDLETLRKCAKALDVSVADLLLPEDAPNQPSDDEAKMLAELRALPGYDPRMLVVIAGGIVEIVRAAATAAAIPRSLAGDAKSAARLAKRWNSMDEEGRGKMLVLMDAARDFSGE